MSRRWTFFLALAWMAAAGTAGAQPTPVPWRGAVGAHFETYDFLAPGAIGIERVSLASVPFGARVPVIDRLSLEVRGAFAHATLERSDGTETTLSGPTDTELRANVAAWGDQLGISLGVLLPTGNSTHTLDEAEVAGLIAADLLPFRVSNWGSGGGGGVVTTLALPVGSFGVGVSAGYTVGREFEPMEEEQVAYRPGDELRLRVAIDRSFGRAGKGSLVLGAQQYSDDELGGETVFRPGDRYEAMASFAFAAGAGASGVVYGGVQHREAGALGALSLETPAQDLFLAGGGVRLPRGGATVVPAAELRVFRRSDGTGQGHLATVGGSVEWPLQGVTLVPTVRTRFGRVLLWEGEETSVRGGEIGLGLRLGR